MAQRYPTLCDRIIANSVLAQDSFYAGTPCWLWTGKTYVNRTGMEYGRINIHAGGKHVTAKVHRVVVVAFTGRTLTKDQVVQHLCNNTICCNPAHLQGGTQTENMRQMVRDGRHRNQHSAAA